MSDRKLVTVVTIKNIAPIEGADVIALATFEENSWQVIVKKEGFQIGDAAVYFEIDSALDTNDERYAFLKGRCVSRTINETTGKITPCLRIKTIRMKGTFSQGLCLPLSYFPELTGKQSGYDATDDLHVQVWNNIKPQRHTERGQHPIKRFPYFCRKTDEERIQSINPRLLEQITPDWRWDVSVKLDGSSLSVFCCLPGQYVKQTQFGICSRNLMLYTSKHSWWQRLWDKLRMWYTFGRRFKKQFGFELSSHCATAMSYDIENKLVKYCEENKRSLEISGEMIGEGIQKNRMLIKGKEWRIFNIFDIDRQEYVDFEERNNILIDLGLAAVPTLDSEMVLPFKEGTLDIQAIIASADGKGVNGTPREGLVYKLRRTPGDTREPKSFKVISNKYLLAEKDE